MELIINTCLWTGQAIRSSGYLCGIRRGWSWLAWFVRPPVKCPGNGHTLSQARPPRPTSPARHGHATPGARCAGNACGASLPFQALAVGGREGLAGEI